MSEKDSAQVMHASPLFVQGPLVTMRQSWDELSQGLYKVTGLRYGSDCSAERPDNLSDESVSRGQRRCALQHLLPERHACSQ